MPTWNDVRQIGLALPGVEEGRSYGTPSLRVRKKFMCRMRTEPDALVARVLDRQEAEALLEGQPDVFFSTPHYDGHPYVLVRLKKIGKRQLAEVIEDAWRTQAAKTIVAKYDAG